MDWLPNEDAMQYFCRDILPLIRAEEPGATLAIVGRTPTPAVKRLAEEHGVTVTGRVDDVRPYMRDAAVYIVPLRIGGGTRLKIFEAMAMGKAVVSTTVGAEGLPVTNGDARGCWPTTRGRSPMPSSRLLRDPDRRQQLEAAARALVVEHYDWSAVAGSLEEALIRFSGGRRRPLLSTTGLPRGRHPHHQPQRPTWSARHRDVMRVSVFGLGYVGCVSAASFAGDGHEVVGVDVNADKVASINAGCSPIVEPGLDDLLGECASQGRLRATTDTADAIDSTDVSLLCVGTPSRKNGSLDLQYLERVSEEVGARLAGKTGLPRRRRAQHGAAGHDARAW